MPTNQVQILGNLYPHNPAKAHKAVSHFKEAAARSDKDPEVWEMLGELLAPTDPSGGCHMLRSNTMHKAPMPWSDCNRQSQTVGANSSQLDSDFVTVSL